MIPQLEPATKLDIAVIVQGMLDLPQVEAPVAHYFGPGIYIRALSMSAGTFAVGHNQRFEHLNIFLQGRIALLNADGSTQEIAAPMIFVAPPGRKMGYIMEDTLWLNVYATELKDVEKIEECFFDKGEEWQAHESNKIEEMRAMLEDDRIDYANLLKELNLVEEPIKVCRPLPSWASLTSMRRSPIHGTGVFLGFPQEQGRFIAAITINGELTEVGRYLNHSKHPNCLVTDGPDGLWLMSATHIAGAKGGWAGDELTVDYRKNFKLHGLKEA